MPQPDPAEVMRDPRVQMLVQEITANVGAAMQGLVGQAVQRIESSVSPSGRIVEIVRRGLTGTPVKVQTTSPQLLAELNDHLMDLIAEIQTANELTREQLDLVNRDVRRRKRE